ncbi:hypothetical protein ACLMJK_005207 [Lecanora helva]
MGLLTYVELCFAWLMKNFRNHDARLFTKGPAFTSFPTSTIEVTSPSCGPSGSVLQPRYSQVGEDDFPTLTWPAASPEIREYILLFEDADMPLPGPLQQRVFHALCYSIPPSKTGVAAGDFEISRAEAKGGSVKGGFRFTKNIRGVAYVGARPVLGHGPHRYFYQLVALKEPLDLTAFGGAPSKAQVAKAIEGKVAGWGAWVGVFERKWQ